MIKLQVTISLNDQDKEYTGMSIYETITLPDLSFQKRLELIAEVRSRMDALKKLASDAI